MREEKVSRKVNLNKKNLENIHFGIRCNPDDHPFFQSIHSGIAFILCILFFKIILVENSYSGARNCINSVPQAASTTFAFPSVFILFYDNTLHSTV